MANIVVLNIGMFALLGGIMILMKPLADAAAQESGGQVHDILSTLTDLYKYILLSSSLGIAMVLILIISIIVFIVTTILKKRNNN